jgi:hypothetical protein
MHCHFYYTQGEKTVVQRSLSFTSHLGLVPLSRSWDQLQPWPPPLFKQVMIRSKPSVIGDHSKLGYCIMKSLVQQQCAQDNNHNGAWASFSYKLVLVERWQSKARSEIFTPRAEFMNLATALVLESEGRGVSHAAGYDT